MLQPLPQQVIPSERDDECIQIGAKSVYETSLTDEE